MMKERRNTIRSFFIKDIQHKDEFNTKTLYLRFTKLSFGHNPTKLRLVRQESRGEGGGTWAPPSKPKKKQKHFLTLTWPGKFLP